MGCKEMRVVKEARVVKVDGDSASLTTLASMTCDYNSASTLTV